MITFDIFSFHISLRIGHKWQLQYSLVSWVHKIKKVFLRGPYAHSNHGILKYLSEESVLRIRDVNPGSYFFIPDPGLSRSRIQGCQDPGSASKNVSTLNPKTDTKFSKIRSAVFIADPWSLDLDFFHLWSRGQQSPGFRIRICHTAEESTKFSLKIMYTTAIESCDNRIPMIGCEKTVLVLVSSYLSKMSCFEINMNLKWR